MVLVRDDKNIFVPCAVGW